MAFTRYNKRRIFSNSSLDYVFSDIFRKRNARSITQYETARLNYPVPSQIQELKTEIIVWTVGEKYFKLANQYYGDPAYWWIIAWYNEKPVEANIKAGDRISIPLPLELILDFFNII